ncbi:hypothetical protein KM043_002895 [Ampulex compressa]|nr:hypothetical protein KM043_002895 [Ampulex compressa]
MLKELGSVRKRNKADKGMLLKLDFRDEFKLEDSPDCRFDFLEVRDGQHGYSNLLGSFCGTDFPPEITSKTRYLWLRFRSDENIEGKGFKAVWSMIPRPTYPGVPPEPEPCITNVTGMEGIIHSNDVKERKKQAEKEGLSLDCMWIITVKDGWKIQLTFPDRSFKLQRPNECDANFVDIFKERTDMPSRKRNYCGSIADAVIIDANTAYIRFYAEPKALNSSFEAVMTAIREKETGEKTCRENEYDCEDATCIAANLQCNGRLNCRFRWDEDEQSCDKKKSRLIDKQHIVIILVVFSLIMFGMSFAFVFNCVRKLVRDHRIIREHIRQSRENRLDELGRKSTPCPISSSRTDIRDRGSESPSLEVVPSKELLPPTTLIAQEYTKDLVMEMTYNARDMNDIHQSNNVSNATQERLQECSEEPEMRDNSCQTRESLFEPRAPPSPMGFTTFGVRGPSSQNGTNYLHHHRHHHHHHPQQSPQDSQQSSQQSSEHSSQQQTSQCSGCSPASRGRDGSMGVCPKHNPIPAPPGWSTHESSYHQSSPYPEPLDYPSYQRFPSPKHAREAYGQSGRQATVGSGERYGSSIYGSGHASSNATSSTQHSGTPKCPQAGRDQQDPREGSASSTREVARISGERKLEETSVRSLGRANEEPSTSSTEVSERSLPGLSAREAGRSHGVRGEEVPTDVNETVAGLAALRLSLSLSPTAEESLDRLERPETLRPGTSLSNLAQQGRQEVSATLQEDGGHSELSRRREVLPRCSPMRRQVDRHDGEGAGPGDRGNHTLLVSTPNVDDSRSRAGYPSGKAPSAELASAPNQRDRGPRSSNLRRRGNGISHIIAEAAIKASNYLNRNLS